MKKARVNRAVRRAERSWEARPRRSPASDRYVCARAFSRASAHSSAKGISGSKTVRNAPTRRTILELRKWLLINDFRRAISRRSLRKVRKSVLYGEASKGGKSRRVPLWWDRGTLDDLAAWRAHRAAQGAVGDEPFVASWQPGRKEETLSRFTLRKRYRTACRKLGAERLQSLTIHHGRHTFISHALAGGRTLAEVRDAAGHSNVTVTSGYLHVAVEDDGVGALFG